MDSTSIHSNDDRLLIPAQTAIETTPSDLRGIDIPLRGYDGWINYSCLARVIAVAGAKGMSLEDFMCEAASDLIEFGKNFEELKDWVSDHLADICREAQLLTDGRYTSEEYFWTLIHNLVDEAKASNRHLQ